MQIRHPDFVIWFGETSRRFYVMDDDGLHEFADTDAVLLFAWQRTARPAHRAAQHRPVGFDDGLDDLRETLTGPLRELIAARPDLAHTPAQMAGER
ncbi:hypothetical protein [Streptomonospora salina]|uniref:Uncharacterized protein n=1 Tax=Streptomonospora salina TaxID=104205 RepID=A0A841E5F8_9ACTN|nr:hypothetical protein [Streptomonospora salina]MBB5998246.1 hypothetical protein [Streptomonospora salina]